LNPDLKQWVFPSKQHDQLCSILNQHRLIFNSKIDRPPLQEIQCSQLQSDYTPELTYNERLRRLERLIGLPLKQDSPIQRNLTGTDECGFKFNQRWPNFENTCYQADDENSPMDIDKKFTNCRLQEITGRKLQFE
jgi:hypothetical protein